MTGDLARKKLLPAVYDLHNRGLLPTDFVLVGFARRDWGDDDFEDIAREAAQADARTRGGRTSGTGSPATSASCPARSTTTTRSTSSPNCSGRDARRSTGSGATRRSTCRSRRRRSRSCSSSCSGPGWRTTSKSGGWRRVVVEKPFGHDLESSRELNDLVDDVFTAEDVFRIDHYLGKETVQNILALRFANTLFEPVWNANYVDSVQITMAEDVGIGSRAGFYDQTGAARDVLQNHVLQLLALTAMEEPVEFTAGRDPHREDQGAAGDHAARRPRRRTRSAGSTRRAGWPASGWSATGRRRTSRRTRTPRRTRRSSSTSRPAAGPGCRSTCAPASGCRAGSPRSRSCSRRRRTCRSPRPTPRSWATTSWSSGCSRTRA